MHYLFGYGSLINIDSASKTLQRSLSLQDLIPARIDGYVRSWTAAIDVVIPDRGDRRVAGLFLDLTAGPSVCNGVLIKISDSELLRMDQRERGYCRQTVLARHGSHSVQAITYIVPTTQKNAVGVALAQYLEMVTTGVKAFGLTFQRQFWGSTQSVPRPLVTSAYTFADPHQKQAVDH